MRKRVSYGKGRIRKAPWNDRGRSAVTRESVEADLMALKAMAHLYGWAEAEQSLIDGSGKTVAVAIVRV